MYTVELFSKFLSILLMGLSAATMLILVEADVIMMGENGMPNIIENDDFDSDVILMPGMGNMLINDDLVL